MNTCDIAESLFGPIEWIDAVTGFVPCPGKELHSNRSTKRDCRIKLNGAPTVFCVHNSCAGILADKNKELRSAVGKFDAGKNGNASRKWKPTASDIQRGREREQAARLKLRAEKSLSDIIAANPCEPVDLWESSPCRLEDDGADDWRLLLRLYRATDVLWIGALQESGSPKHARNFRTVAEWLSESDPPGQHICPNLFRVGEHSRTAENVISTRFLVVESDALPKNSFCAVLQWLQKFMWMRAVVDTAGKSLHGWFEYPEAEILRELKTILPALKCDGALFQVAHTCRLPGAMREGKWQHLLFLDLEGVQ